MRDCCPSGYARCKKQLMADIIYMIEKYEEYNGLNLLADDQVIYAIELLARDVFDKTEYSRR